MAKFVIECPKCSAYVQASNFIFAKKNVKCSCGEVINVSANRMTSRVCSHCGNNVVFDQAKGEKAICPVCKEKINTSDNTHRRFEFECPNCSCNLSADKHTSDYTCPLCDTHIPNVQAMMEQMRIKKQSLPSVLKWEGDNKTLVFKHPIQDFKYGSQLIVHESQKAIFFRDGEALDEFGAGRHTLETQNLPILGKLYSLPVDAETIFHSEVYFFNMTVQMGVKWGIGDLSIRDPFSGIYAKIGCFGEFSIQIENPRLLLLDIVGTSELFTHDSVIASAEKEAEYNNIASNTRKSNDVINRFKAMIQSTIKNNLALLINQNQISLLDIDSSVGLLSEKLLPIVNEKLQKYGLRVPDFFIGAVHTDSEQLNQARTLSGQAYVVRQEGEVGKAEASVQGEIEAVKAEKAAAAARIKAAGEADVLLAKAQAEAEEMRMKGYTGRDMIAKEIEIERARALGQMGKNGGGGMVSDLAGLGIGLSAAKYAGSQFGGMFGGMMGDSSQGAFQQNAPDSWTCPKCSTGGITAKFCGNCGAPKPQPAEAWDCVQCGNKGNTTKFCGNCGSPKPQPAEAWDCVQCGNKGNTTKFCGNCGSPKPEAPASWDCPKCGNKGNTTKFCGNCGTERGES